MGDRVGSGSDEEKEGAGRGKPPGAGAGRAGGSRVNAGIGLGFAPNEHKRRELLAAQKRDADALARFGGASFFVEFHSHLHACSFFVSNMQGLVDTSVFCRGIAAADTPSAAISASLCRTGGWEFHGG